MGSTISVNRKGADLFFTLEGNFNDNSCQELVDALKNLVMTLLKCTAPASQWPIPLKPAARWYIKETVRDNQGTDYFVV